MASRQTWLEVLTPEQRELRKQERYDEINLTEEQKKTLGDEGICFIESPSFYEVSRFCD